MYQNVIPDSAEKDKTSLTMNLPQVRRCRGIFPVQGVIWGAYRVAVLKWYRSRELLCEKWPNCGYYFWTYSAKDTPVALPILVPIYCTTYIGGSTSLYTTLHCVQVDVTSNRWRASCVVRTENLQWSVNDTSSEDYRCPRNFVFWWKRANSPVRLAVLRRLLELFKYKHKRFIASNH
jgi:hypothetical protein